MTAQSTNTGSNATDFQPTTANPQSDVNTNLQPNSGGLQPITYTGDSNVFGQPGINAQAFPETKSLTVTSTSPRTLAATAGLASSSPENLATKNTSWSPLIWFFVALAGVMLLIIFLVKISKPANSASEKVVKLEPPAMAKPPKLKKRKVKKRKQNSKKRK